MAKVPVTPVDLEFNAASTPDVEAMTTDGAELAVGDASKLVLLVENTDTDDVMTVTVKAGIYSDKDIGDLAVSVPISSKRFIGPFESARFEDATEKIQVETASTGTLSGYIQAIKLP